MRSGAACRPCGRFRVEHWRAGELIGVYEIPNGTTNGGMDSMLDVNFHASAQIATWYLGLIDNAAYSAVAAADTMSSHAGWAESTAYGEANRIEWVEGAASSQAITNSAYAEFTANGTVSIKGLFLTSDNTKNATAGTLHSTGVFVSAVPLVNTDSFRVYYTVTMSDETA